MQKAAQQHKAEGHQTTPTRSRNVGPSLQFVPAASEGFAGLESSSPLMQRQGQLAQRISNSERLLGQRRSFDSYHAATQRRALEFSQNGRPVQRVQEEDTLQGKFAIQRAEEEEPLQGKFAAQRVEEEESFAAQRVGEEEPLQGKFAKQEAVQRKEGGASSSSGLPENLRSGIESLSGMAMDHVKVHYNSPKPAQLNAHAFAQGSAIHVAPGQERHLPHEAWHVVQQAQGRVQPTMQMKTGVPINDDSGLEREADVMGAKASASGAVPAQRVGSGSYVPLPGIEEEKTPNVEKPAYEQMEEDGQEVEARRSETGILGSLKRGVSWLGDKLGGAKDSVADKAGQAKEWASEHQEGIKSAFGGVKDESSQTMSLAQGIDDVQQASPKVGLDVFQKSDSVWNKIFGATVGNGIQKALGVLTELVTPLVNAGLAFLDAKTKWGQWNTYKNVVMDEKGQKKPDATPEAVYALDKIPKGFYRKVAEFFIGVGEFTMNLLTIIPSGIGQIVGLAGKIALSAGKMIGTLAGKAKGLFQAIFGEKKVANSQSLLDKALAKDEKSLKLILSLKLPSIAGTDYKLLDALQGMKHNLTESATSTIKGGLGLNNQKADRIIDKYGAGTGGPSDTKTLHEYLALISINAASKELILGELKETMTGVGT